MKAVILAGGKGSRISEESQFRPKPLIEIGGKPIIWHIMKLYSYYGINEFIVCCGYKGHLLKEYFVNYHNTQADYTYHLGNSETDSNEAKIEPFKVTLIDTGAETLTSGRLLQIQQYLKEEKEFFLTYGDGVSNVDIGKLLAFHHAQGKCVTITSYEQEERFGKLLLDDNHIEVKAFKEKNKAENGLVNAGFMVMNQSIFRYLGDGGSMLEEEPFEKISLSGQMAAYPHKGFWSPMDTLKEQIYLEELWQSGIAPWKVWE